MQLDINGVKYTSHFVHGMRETKCIFHAGECVGRECIDKYVELEEGDSYVSIGQAKCNTMDQFSKAKGRILAFTRALSTHPATAFNPELRGELWASYFKIAPRKR
jgi:hypothetical protein